MTTWKFCFAAVCVPAAMICLCCTTPQNDDGENQKPNILFVIADDHSFPNASAYGTKDFPTPAFDEVARRGVLFTNAFVAAPQCSPSRAAILTGRNIWQLEEAGTHSSYFPNKYPVFTQRLEENGYAVGYTGKAWGPGNWKDSGWLQNPVGKEYNDLRFDTVPTTGISRVDYPSNFQRFLDERKDGQPFFFWFGAHEPHRDYEYGSGLRHFRNQTIAIPPFLPVHDSTGNDMLDYAREVAWFDSQLAEMLSILAERGELANTIVVVTADNGMPFPHAKANMHEFGIHVPLAICGPSIQGNRKVDDLVSLIDLAPTFLEASGSGPMEDISGVSLLARLFGEESGKVDSPRQYVLSGRERHTHARPDNAGYPARAMRTSRFLYIRNFKPDRWPVGNPPPSAPVYDPDDSEIRPVLQGYEDIDDSPSKRLMIAQKGKWPELFNRAFAMRPAEELYDIREDPFCLTNLSAHADYRDELGMLRHQLEAILRDQQDPRVTGNGDIFETYPRFGRMRAFPGFRKKGEYNRRGQITE